MTVTDRAYARISLETDASNSLARQRSDLGKVAAADAVFYEDRSVSGSVPFAERPDGARLLADLRKGDRLLVTKIDRAARNVRDLLGLVEHVEAVGASVLFTGQNIDTSGPGGRMVLTMLGAIAEFERELIRERVRESRAYMMEGGQYGGGPIPFGFCRVANTAGKGYVLRPDPSTAPLAREVVGRVLAGEAQRSLAPLLGLGEPGFSRWLRSPALAGIREGATLTIDPDAALLSLAEWRALQDHLKRPAKAWSKADGYGAALACGICGQRLYYARNKRYPDSSVYRCGRRAHADGDPAVAVVRRHADAHIEREFLALLGGLPVTETLTVDSSAERDEAIARARIALDAARTAFEDATDDDAEDSALDAQRAAKRALRDAEAMPDTTATVDVETGETFAQAWKRADDAERTEYLSRVGPWYVSPGRGLEISDKVRRADDVPDYLAGEV